MKTFQFARARFIRWYQSGLALFFRYLFLAAGLVGLVILLSSLVIPVSVGLRAIAVFLLAPLSLAESVNLFVSYLQQHPEFMLNEALKTNIFNRLDFASQNVLAEWQGRTLAQLLAAFFQIDETRLVLLRFALTDQDFTTLPTAGELDEKALTAIIETAAARRSDQTIISVYDFLAAVLSQSALQPVLQEQELNADVVQTVLDFYGSLHHNQQLRQSWWLNRQGRTGGIGKTWSVSYTNLLDQLTLTIPSTIRERAAALPLFSRSELVKKMSVELNKAEGQNLLLVGEPGIGKQEIFWHFAAEVTSYQTQTPLDGKEPRLLDVQRLLAQANSPAALQQLLDALFAELTRSDNIILFIDPIAELLSSSKLGEADVSNVLEAHLSDGRVHIIGAATSEEYLKIIKPNRLLAERFSVIEVPPPTPADRLPILLSQLNRFENRYRVFFTIEALDELIKLAERYVKDKVSPARELDLVEEVAAAAHATGRLIIGVEDVRSVVEKEAQVPLQVAETEQKTLLNLEAELHQRVIGQNHAIKLVSDALVRARAGLSTGHRPIGTFLFLGPTGVGKTETAKALAAIYFGSDKKLIRLDMTEYADAGGLSKLLGTDQTEQPGALTLAIQQNPSAVVLFDEFEKASLAVKNVLLQLLDEGRLTTNYGHVLDFTNAIVIATSNAGSDYIKDQITNQTPIEQFEKPLIDKLISDRLFSPELLNRFDGVVVFSPLSLPEIEQVVGLQIQLLKSQVKKDKGIELEIAPMVLTELAKRGYDPVFGARALERVIKNDLETAIAKQIISQAPKPGSTLTVTSLP